MKLRLPWRAPTPADLAAQLGTVRLPTAPVLPPLLVTTPRTAQHHGTPRGGGRATYRVTFSDVGVVPLIVHQVTRAELAIQIAGHYASYTGTEAAAVVDVKQPQGLLRAHDATASTFTLAVLPTAGGASDA